MPCCKMTIRDNRPCDKKVVECFCFPTKGKSCICVCKDEHNKIVVCDDCLCSNLPCDCKKGDDETYGSDQGVKSDDSKEATKPKCDKDGCECILTEGKACICLYVDSKGNIAKCDDCDSSDTCDKYCSCEGQTVKCIPGAC